MQLGLDRTGRRSLSGHSTVSVFWIVNLFTGSTGNSFPQCSLLFYSTALTFAFIFSSCQHNWACVQACLFNVYKEKKCQCCKTRDPQELHFSLARWRRPHWAVKILRERSVFVSNPEKEIWLSQKSFNKCIVSFFPSKWFPSTPLYSFPSKYFN